MHARMHVKLNKYELHGCFTYNMVARFAICIIIGFIIVCDKKHKNSFSQHI